MAEYMCMMSIFSPQTWFLSAALKAGSEQVLMYIHAQQSHTEARAKPGVDGDHRPQPFLEVIAHISLCVSLLLGDTLNVTDFCLTGTSPRLLRKISQKMMHAGLPGSPGSTMVRVLDCASWGIATGSLVCHLARHPEE